jgi:hypothetical protein
VSQDSSNWALWSIFCNFVSTINQNIEAARSRNLNQPSDRNSSLRTLVYLASGKYKKEYESLPVDRIFLVDHHCFPSFKKTRRAVQMYSSSKVTCLGMDALEAIDFFKENNIVIDILVIINEGLAEGGGYMALCANSVLSYISRVLRKEYIHILSTKYYSKDLNINLDLPIEKQLLSKVDEGWIDPTIFSEDWGKHAEVFRVNQKPSVTEIHLNPNIQTLVIHDTIWNYYDQLGLVVLSTKDQGRRHFFGTMEKVMLITDLSLSELFEYCDRNKIESIGFTPWARGRYSSFIDLIKEYRGEFPKRISLFYLNNSDYATFRNLK